jgi:hypothetical protein
MRYHVLAVVVCLAALGGASVLTMLPYWRHFLKRPERTTSVALSTGATLGVVVWLVTDDDYAATPVLLSFGALMLTVLLWTLQWVMALDLDRLASAGVAASALSLWVQVDERWVSYLLAVLYFHAFFYETLAVSVRPAKQAAALLFKPRV